MTDSSFSWPLFHQCPIVGIIRHISAEDVRQILPVYQASGLTTVEITMNTPDAQIMIQEARQHHPTTLNVGAGTVCSEADLEQALEAGAQFIVTPVINKKVIKACVKKRYSHLSRCLHPLRNLQSLVAGASMVKVFPTTALGPGYIRDIKAPLSQIKLLPTGGVSLENMTNFLKAGADGFGIGSGLFDKKLIGEKDWKGFEEAFFSV